MAMKTFSPLTAAVGAAFLASAALAPVAAATATVTENPFASQELSGGYNLAAKDAEGKCGEGKCGEGKCGASGEEDKAGEGKCGEDKGSEEGKSGEGKCGGAA